MVPDKYLRGNMLSLSNATRPNDYKGEAEGTTESLNLVAMLSPHLIQMLRDTFQKIKSEN